MTLLSITSYGGRPEYGLLAIAILLGIVHLVWAATAARRQQNLKWARGPRDEPMPITGMAARLDRGFKNYMETFPFFAAAVIVAHLTQAPQERVDILAIIFIVARLSYLGCYLADWHWARSLVWFVGSMATLVLVVVALMKIWA